jgi:hypothetical protein
VAVVTTSGTQTLTNKTLTAPTLTTPVIATISNTGTLTLPTSTDTLVGRATTDTLTNKTLTTPTIASFTNATHSHQNNAGGGTLDHGAALTGLTDDDHTQYGLLAGRSSGQTLNGGNAANEDIIINGTAHATKASSYVILQPTGGNVVVGGSTAEYNFEVQDQGGSNYRMTVNLNDSSENVLGSINDAVGSYTQAPLRIFASRIRFNGVPNIMTSATPTGSGSGTAGDIAWDTSYIYVCTATNTWKRAALSTF